MQIRIAPSALIVAVSAFSIVTSHAARLPAPPTPRVRQSFDAGWRFRLGDAGYTSGGTPITQWLWKAAAPGDADNPAPALAATGGAGWQPAAIGQDVFDRKPGFAWFRATLPTLVGRPAILHFGGVDDNATVFVNGQRVARHEGWDSSFDVDFSAAIKPGQPNQVDVLVENRANEGGLAKPVTLEEQNANASGPASAQYADTAWHVVNVPHDWMIEGVPGKDPAAMEGPFDRTSPATHEGGYLNGGIGWYRKTFTVPATARGQRVYIQFDGVYMDADVWLNGVHLGNHPYGYTSFGYDLTPHLRYGAPNVIAVRCNVEQPCSRFYSGAGIYRHVWLTFTAPVHVAPWGTYVTTPKVGAASAQAQVLTRVQNDSQAANVTLISSVLAPGGQTVATAEQTKPIPAGGDVEFAQTIAVPNPRLWSLETPTLYKVVSSVRVGRALTDSYSTNFGIRTIEFTKDNGFLLNGQRVQIKGVCNHHDLGCLGAAVNTRAIERQLEIVRSFGCNAIRTSHNPPAPELLDLCDRMGFLVMDEAFDEWKAGKKPFGYSRFFDAWSEPDLISMTHRDRNHPSIVLWSIGNEINEQGASNGEAMSQRLADIVRREDPTRPTTSAMSNPSGAEHSGFAKPLGVFGVNYNIGSYKSDRIKGHWPMLGSETSSTLNSRGEYGLALDNNGQIVIHERTSDNELTGYDLVRPGWGCTAETSFKGIRDAPWMAGEFVWTGFDYIGEPTPFRWPSRSAYFGIVDLCGFPKDRTYLYQSQWTNKPVVHILPQNWNWPGFEGKIIPVWIYTNADAVELFLNGKSLGTQDFKTTQNLHLEFQVPYAPGVLRAVATKAGKVIATDEVHTAGPPAKLVLLPDRQRISADGEDLSFVQARVVDRDGNLCPNADNEIRFTLNGPGVIAGLDNGDETNHEPFQSPPLQGQHKAFHGLALAVLKAGNRAGSMTLTATAPGLADAKTVVQSAAQP